jgi:hypothetical protein
VLSASVGQNETNLLDDVKTVQRLLGDLQIAAGAAPAAVDGVAGLDDCLNAVSRFGFMISPFTDSVGQHSWEELVNGNPTKRPPFFGAISPSRIERPSHASSVLVIRSAQDRHGRQSQQREVQYDHSQFTPTRMYHCCAQHDNNQARCTSR